MPRLDRSFFAGHIAKRLAQQRDALRRHWRLRPIASLIVDDLLPPETANALWNEFPPAERLTARRNMREASYLGAELESYSPLLREAAAAFHDPRVVDAIARLTNTPELLRQPEPSACGVSRMDRGGFENPHVDASLDPRQRNPRVLALVYHVTPDLRLCDGGHLELWHDGPDREPTTILSKFNRLVVLATHGNAWRSISPIRGERERCCIWTYYHASRSVQPSNDNYVAAYRGRPEQRVRDLLLRADTFARESATRIALDERFVAALRLVSGDKRTLQLPEPARESGEAPRVAASDAAADAGSSGAAPLPAVSAART